MHVHLNAAVSIDGKLALPGGRPLLLSSPEDLRRVHLLRHESDAILVGAGTVLADDPSLLTKADLLPPGAVAPGGKPRHPLRVVLDSRLRTPATARVFDGRAPTLVLTAGVEGERPHARVAPAGPPGGQVDLGLALAELDRLGVRRLLVEGGGRVLGSFLEAGCVDAFTLYVAPVVVGEGAPSLVRGFAAASAEDALALRLLASARLGDGVLLSFARR